MMNLKALRHHGSLAPPAPDHLTLRYYLGGSTFDTDADGTQTFVYPDGPFVFYALGPSATNPPLLDWLINSDNSYLLGSIGRDTVNLGGGLTTAARLTLQYFPRHYLGSTFEAQAFEHDTVFPYSTPYGPLLEFACDPSAHDPSFDAGNGWYVNRFSDQGGFHEIDSAVSITNQYPAGWDTAEKVKQGNLIALLPDGYAWGTLANSRFSYVVTQTAGPARDFDVEAYTTTDAGNRVRQNDWATFGGASNSDWWTFDTYAGALTAPHPFNAFVVAKRQQMGYDYTGTAYSIQPKLLGVDFGTAINLACEV
jgi:hypothetical protein